MQQVQLNYQRSGSGPVIILLHGLFGSLDNLFRLAKSLEADYDVIRVDLRNHGHSPHCAQMNYSLMAEDLCVLIERLNLDEVMVIGHSMGGKVAMALCALMPARVKCLVILDMAPVAYVRTDHAMVFRALNAVGDAHVQSRAEALPVMRRYLDNDAIIFFLLKSFQQGQWLFNLPVLEACYPDILAWQEQPSWDKPILFMCGAQSDYVRSADWPDILRQFPRAKAEVIAGAGHWLHADQPETTEQIIKAFLKKADACFF